MFNDSDFTPTPGQAHLLRAQELCKQYKLANPQGLAAEMAHLYQTVSAASVGALLITAKNGRSRLANDVRRIREVSRKAKGGFAGALREDEASAGAIFANVFGDGADIARTFMRQFVSLDIEPGRKPAHAHICSLIFPLMRFWAQHRQNSGRRVSLAHQIDAHDGTFVRPKPGGCGEFVIAALASVNADIPPSSIRSQWGAVRKRVRKETPPS